MQPGTIDRSWHDQFQAAVTAIIGVAFRNLEIYFSENIQALGKTKGMFY